MRLLAHVVGALPDDLRPELEAIALEVESATMERVMPMFGVYIARKVALETLRDVLRVETAGGNVRFSTVNMGLVRTPMIELSRDVDRFPALSL